MFYVIICFIILYYLKLFCFCTQYVTKFSVCLTLTSRSMRRIAAVYTKTWNQYQASVQVSSELRWVCVIDIGLRRTLNKIRSIKVGADI